MADPVYGYWTMFGPGTSTTAPTTPESSPASPAPVYHSIITGTFDPTPAEIVAAATASGSPVPAGMDPVEFSRMMSGLPPVPISASSSSPASSIPVLPISGSSLPASTIASSSVPSSPDYSAYVASYPDISAAYVKYKDSGGKKYPTAASYGEWHWGTYGSSEGRILPSSGVSGSPFTAAMKAPSFDGGGGLLCDPITGKCPQYR